MEMEMETMNHKNPVVVKKEGVYRGVEDANVNVNANANAVGVGVGSQNQGKSTGSDKCQRTLVMIETLTKGHSRIVTNLELLSF